LSFLVLVPSILVGCGAGSLGTPRRASSGAVALESASHAQRQQAVPPAPVALSDAMAWTIVASHHHAVMLGMRLTEVWLWPEPFADTDVSRVTRRHHDALRLPPKWHGDARWFEWDGDRWWINVVGHALFGSELYLAARRCQFSPVAALAATTLSSALWEYGYEASGVRPSALDLIYTPLAGAALGELRHWVYRELHGSATQGPLEVVFKTLMDPFGTLERAAGSPC